MKDFLLSLSLFLLIGIILFTAFDMWEYQEPISVWNHDRLTRHPSIPDQ